MTKIHLIKDKLSIELGKKLKKFESIFQYPLGSDKTFTISHGEEYIKFYQSMGETFCFFAEDENNVLGTFSCCLRTLINKHSHQKEIIAYLGDLKIIPTKQNTFLFNKLAQEMIRAVQNITHTAIAVVMDGTAKTPANYSGRLNIPKFHPLNKAYIFHIETRRNINCNLSTVFATEQSGLNRYLDLSLSDYYFEPKENNLRSKINPTWLISEDNNACGMLEDTMLAKRLFNEQHQEINSAHLSYFSFKDPLSAICLLSSVLDICHKTNFSNLFFSLSEKETELLTPLMSKFMYQKYPATVYGTLNAKHFEFKINTSEI